MRVDWPENIDELLATESDCSLSRRLGIARTTIMRRRHKLGIRCHKRLSVSDALQGLIDAVEGSKYPKPLVLVQAMQVAKQVLKGAGADEPDRSVC